MSNSDNLESCHHCVLLPLCAHWQLTLLFLPCISSLRLFFSCMGFFVAASCSVKNMGCVFVYVPYILLQMMWHLAYADRQTSWL